MITTITTVRLFACLVCIFFCIFFATPALYAQKPAMAAFPFDRQPTLVPALVKVLEWQDRREADSLIRALQTSTGEASELVRARAALALASVQDKRAAEPLAKALADADPSVRSLAAFALGQLGMGNTSKDPIEVAETALLLRWDVERELPVRLAILEALGKCGGQTAMIRLTNTPELKNPTTPKSLTASGLLAIARLGLRKIMAPTVNAYCFEALRRPDATTSPEIAFAASYIFARAPIDQWRPHADALAALIATRKIPAEAAINLAKGYAKTKNWQYLETIKTLAKSADWRVRVECARAFGAMPSTGAVVTLLVGLSNDRSEQVQIIALEQMQRQFAGFAADAKADAKVDAKVDAKAANKLDAKTVQSLKTRASTPVSANGSGLEPSIRAALVKAIAAADPNWVWNERERWKSEQSVVFQMGLAEAIGNTNELEAQKYLQTLVLRGQMMELFNLAAAANPAANPVANAKSTNPATNPATNAADKASSLVLEERRSRQKKDILAATALRALESGWKRSIAPQLVGTTTPSVAATSATGLFLSTCQRALQSGDAGLMTTAAESLSDTLLIPFGSVRLLTDRLETLKPARDLEPMQAIIRTLVALKAPEGLPLMTMLLLDSSDALAETAADGFEALVGQRPQTDRPKRDGKPIVLDKLREGYGFSTNASANAPASAPLVQVVTKYGSFTMALNIDSAPLTSLHFLELVKSGALNGVPFHRIVPNFVVQGGDFERGDGYGGSEVTIRSEFVPMPFERGVVGMASAGKDTEGSQWFVMHSYAPHLDGRYTAFARVVEGMSVVEQILPFDEAREVKIKTGTGKK